MAYRWRQSAHPTIKPIDIELGGPAHGWQLADDGLTLVPPGVVATSRWRSDSEDAVSGPGEVDAMCGIGFKQ
jgi:S-adenosyl methyltransferase